MILDYSKQLGKKMITKGHQKACVHIESIVYIQCHGGLSVIYLNDESQEEEIKTLKAFEEDLCGMGFIRISRDTIVNGKYVTEVNTNNGKRVVCLGEIVLNVSKRRLGELRGQLF